MYKLLGEQSHAPSGKIYVDGVAVERVHYAPSVASGGAGDPVGEKNWAVAGGNRLATGFEAE